jgi:hypothetical protein
MADDGDTCLFIDVQVSVGNRNIYATKLLLQSEEDLYADAVEEVLAEYAATVADDAAFVEGSDDDVDPIKVVTQALLGRIKSVKCTGKPTELYKFLQRSVITLKMLNSAATPIFKSGIAINLAPKEVRVPPAKDAPNLLNPLDILMGKGEPEHVKFLPPPPDEPEPRMDAQIEARVVELLSEDIKLGYFSITQRACLAKNAGTLVSVLCCVQKDATTRRAAASSVRRWAFASSPCNASPRRGWTRPIRAGRITSTAGTMPFASLGGVPWPRRT